MTPQMKKELKSQCHFAGDRTHEDGRQAWTQRPVGRVGQQNLHPALWGRAQNPFTPQEVVGHLAASFSELRLVSWCCCLQKKDANLSALAE